MTLDDDLVIRLERLSQERGRTFKAVINEAIRAGLDALQRIPEQRISAERVSYTEPLPGRLLLSVEHAIEASDEEYYRKKMGF